MRGTIQAFIAVLSMVSLGQLGAKDLDPGILKADEEQAIDHLLLTMAGDTITGDPIKGTNLPGPDQVNLADKVLFSMTRAAADDVRLPDLPGGITDTPDDGGSFPGYDDSIFPFPTLARRYGAAEVLGMKVLKETLKFYGVYAIVEKQNTRVNFQVLYTKHGYFRHLTKLDVAYAIREFARYIMAHLCNKGDALTFYRLFAQVPMEAIALRFKYDMGFALLGNALPKDPSQVMKMSTHWAALSQILSSTDSLQPSDAEAKKELKSVVGQITDAVNVMAKLNKLLCFVDARPVPKDELKKRYVNHVLLTFANDVHEDNETLRKIVEDAKREGQKAQVEALRGTEDTDSKEN